MSFVGRPKDSLGPAGYLSPLISLEDDRELARLPEMKLIDDSGCHNHALRPSTLAEMSSLNLVPLNSYHEDLSSLIDVSDASPPRLSQSSEYFSTQTKSLTSSLLPKGRGKPSNLDTPGLPISSEYVSSFSRLFFGNSSSENQECLVTQNNLQISGPSGSMQLLPACKVEVQTISSAPVLGSEVIIKQQNLLGDAELPIRANSMSSKVIFEPQANLFSTESSLPSLTAPLPGTEPVANTMSTMTSPIAKDMDPISHLSDIMESTALKTRTTEAVIADLRRPLGRSRHQSENTRDPSLSAVSDGAHLPIRPRTESSQAIQNADISGSTNEDVPNDSDNGDDDDDNDDDDEVRPSTKAKKVSERKRRIFAIADQYISGRAAKAAEKDNVVKHEDEAQQSTRWLVKQSENREIISSAREYQTELFERAKEKNIIAVLDTGTGKTLIAVLLLRHIFAQELENRAQGRRKRISFFLVASVTLVFQQHAVLKANLDQPMDMFCGDMGCDLWSKERWSEHFEKNMVIVCTADVLRQCLHHSFICMDDINFLIFDEAHHAKKDHAYARIIKDFYVSKDDGSTLPKIFGMTASPVDAKVGVKRGAAELETMLHSEIATAKDGTVAGYTIAPNQERLAKYAPLRPKFETPLYQIMYDTFKTNPVFKRPLLYSHQASRELGSWASDQIWKFCLTEEEVKKLLANTERHHYSRKGAEPMEVLEKHKIQIQKAQDVVKGWNFEHPHLDASSFSKNLSSKVVLLVQYLRERFERPTEDKAIVFVSQRYTARLLTELFSFANIGTPHLRTGTLIGTRAGDAGDLQVSFREQVLTMTSFRQGKLNCLFATSVAEEGLDIPDCNLVIRFDLYTTMIQYIQSRGRARQANSRYIHMYEEDNADHTHIIREVRVNESVLKNFCQQLPEDRLLTGCSFDMDHFLAKERTHRVYKVPETGATLTYKISLMVLSNFISSLPNGSETGAGPEYVLTVEGRKFVCEAVLPESSPVRGAVGKACSTKQIAKCSAAFETCLLLRKGGYLNQWLLPIYTKQLPAMRNALLAVDSKKREAYDMRNKPEMWSAGSTPKELFLSTLSLDRPDCLGRTSQPLILLTRLPLPDLPSFHLHFGAGKNSVVLVKPYTEPLAVDDNMLHQINVFTLCIFDDVFSKAYESNPDQMPYFLAPMKTDGPIGPFSHTSEAIDWTVLKSVDDYSERWRDKHWENTTWRDAPDEFFEDKFIVDPWDGSRKLWSVGVNRQFKPLDPVPPNAAPRNGPRKNNDNIMEYSCSLWAKARSRRTFDETQRVIEARYISLRRNLLDEFDASEFEAPKQCWVILEPMKISPLPAPIVAMAYLFPAIIHRVESYLIALDACALLHLKIRPDLALEAMTKDSDNSDEHGSEQINFQRGMGNNYERLEFIGDCFLKMATSISLYGIHPDNDEYRYHVDRMLMICNKNLRGNAIKLKLYEYIRSRSFGRRAWYPEGLVLIRGKTATAPNSHKLGDKTIADICEALIGAALLSSHASRDMDGAVRAVTELVSSENHSVTKFSDYYNLYQKPKYQTEVVTAAQRDLARQVEEIHDYHFKYPRLLKSAFVHPSYPFSYEHIPSYQRLEFLGDSLLDMACVNFLFHEFPAHGPQWLTEHKMAMVSNQFLGALCVSLGFHTHMCHFNTALGKQIKDYVDDITAARFQAEEDAVRAGKTREECLPDYWLSVRHPPKSLPDIVEAYVAAIFVDSEYNYDEVERFFNKHIRWYFKDMSIYDTFANKHPTTFLTNFLQVNMGCMDFDVVTREVPTVDGSKPYIVAVVIVHSKVIADARGESSRYTKIRAAEKAINILKGLPLPEFREKYGCDCRPEEVEADADLDGDIL